MDRCLFPNTTTASKPLSFDAVAFLCLSQGVTRKNKNRALERRKMGIKEVVYACVLVAAYSPQSAS